jgi:Leucine-rich repeat (LRR) protein
LGLSDNNLQSLPESIGELKFLQFLYLAENQLVTLPASIAKLHNLEVLNVTGNLLTELPQNMIQLPKLRTLKTQYNKLPPYLSFNHHQDPKNARRALKKINSFHLRRAILCLLCIRKFSSSIISTLPKDVVLHIAKSMWEDRHLTPS